MVADIFRCVFRNLTAVALSRSARRFVFRKPEMDRLAMHGLSVTDQVDAVIRAQKICGGTKVRVMKVIRLRLEHAMAIDAPKLKKVYLMRDPRAVLNSLSRAPFGENFGDKFTKIKIMCARIWRDHLTFTENPREFIPVKYESLMAKNATEVMTRLVKRLGLEMVLGNDIEGLLRRHGMGETRKRRGDISQEAFLYYSTYRNDTFVHDHWRKELSEERRKQVENDSHCRKFMETVGYWKT